MAGTILVTGGNGYLAGFLIRQLAEQGWGVRTTIRDLARAPALRATLALADDRLAVFQANLTDDAGWAEAMAGCSHVAHVASPFPLEVPRDPGDLIVPAREGALRALRFARDAGVRRFVLTSSTAAVTYGPAGNNRVFTEADWTDLSDPGVPAYPRSKTIAERSARDWIAAEGGGMEFASVNPGAIFGPLLGDHLSTSIELVKRMLDGEVPACPDIGFGVVDVRDVADLHVRVLSAPDMAGERFIASGPFLKVIDFARILHEGLGGAARRVPTRRMPDLLLKAMALFRPELRQLVSELGNVREASSDHARAVLDWEPRPPREAILATARSLLERGIVKV